MFKGSLKLSLKTIKSRISKAYTIWSYFYKISSIYLSIIYLPNLPGHLPNINNGLFSRAILLHDVSFFPPLYPYDLKVLAQINWNTLLQTYKHSFYVNT